MSTALTFITSGIFGLFTLVLGLLPTSDFDLVSYLPDLSSYLGVFNYFVPVSSLISVFETWLAAVLIINCVFYFSSLLSKVQS